MNTSIPSAPPVAQGWLTVKTEYSPLAFALAFCSTQVVVDGQRYKEKWGTSSYAVAAGEHRVEVWVNYLGGKIGRNSVVVYVGADQTCNVRFFMPPLIIARGKMTIS